MADVVTAGAMAMRDGHVLANSLGFPRVEAESDSLDMISFCNGWSGWWDTTTTLFTKCVDVASSIGKVVFRHCYHSSNQATRVLAKFCFCNKTDELDR